MVATDENQLDAVNDDMRLVHSVCADNHILNVVFANPFIQEGKKIAILKDIFDDKISKISMLFISFVVKKRRTVNLKGISNAFVELYRKEKNVVLSHLVTATEVDESARRSVIDKIAEYTGKVVELESEVDPEILGGFGITFDNNMYDDSISTAINKLRKEFSKNVYESKL